MTNELQTVGAMHQCRAGEPYSTCVHCGALAEALNKPCPHFMRDASQKLAGVASPTPQADSTQDEPLQAFDSPRAKALMRAWEEGWAACRDAEYVGEEAQNDAFNSSHTLTLCIAEDQQFTAPQADSALEDAARLDWLALAGPTSICVVIDRPNDGEVEVATDDVTGYGKTLREALDAARKQGGS